MNASLLARNAYSSNQTATRTPRSIEAGLLGSITSDLRSAAQNGADFAKKVDALHRNRKVWATFAMSVADQDNALPASLRAQLFYLAEFTEHHSRLVLKGEASLEALIEVNTMILRGLNEARSAS